MLEYHASLLIYRPNKRNKYKLHNKLLFCCAVVARIPLTNRDESNVRNGAETGSFGDPQPDPVQASVSRHDRLRAVLEANVGGVRKGVVHKLCSVRRRQPDARHAVDDGVALEDVALHPPGLHHPWVVGPLVCVNVVPEDRMRFL